MAEPPAGIPCDVPELWQGYRRWLESREVRTPQVVLHGGYGKNNLGDDAILHVLLERVLEQLRNAEITIVCHGPQSIARRYAHEPRVRACAFKSLAAVRAMLRSHIYIIGGGGIINRINAYSGRDSWKLLDMKGKFLFVAALGAKLSGAQTNFYAIGANSFPDPGVRFLARHVLKTADVVSVRDPGSLETLQSLGLRRPLIQVLDPAFSMQPAPAELGTSLLERWGWARSQRPLVCLGFRYVRDGRTDNAEKVACVVRLIRYLIQERGTEVVFLPASQHPLQHYEDDLDFGRCVQRQLNERNHFFLVEEYPRPEVAMAAFGCADLCVFERLHAVILSSLMSVPLFAISYDAKVREQVQLLGRSVDCIDSDAFMRATDYSWLEQGLLAASRRVIERQSA